MFYRVFSSLVIIGMIFISLTGCTKPVDAKAIEEKLALANKYVMDQKYEEAILVAGHFNLDQNHLFSHIKLDSNFPLRPKGIQLYMSNK